MVTERRNEGSRRAGGQERKRHTVLLEEVIVRMQRTWKPP